MTDNIGYGVEIDFVFPTEEQQKCYREKFGTTEETIKKEVSDIKSWLALHPVLPVIEDEQFLERFHSHCKFKIEKTKRKLEVYYKMRAIEPDMLLIRDPLDPSINKYREGFEIICLPLPTPEGNRVTIARLRNYDPDLFEPEQILKYALMLLDCHIRVDLCLNHAIVVDSKGVDATLLLKLSPGFIKKVDKCCMKSFPHRFAGVHILNTQPFMQATINVFKLVLGKDVGSMLLPHADYDSFHSCVPKKILPEEYGGTYPMNLDQIRDFTHRKLVEKRDWFLKESSLVADLKNDPDSLNDGFGSKGTFKKLEID